MKKAKPFLALTIGFAAALAFLLPGAQAKDWFSGTIGEIVRIFENRPTAVPSSGEIEVGFSPDEGAEVLVLKVINAAKNEIRVQAYSFTSASVMKALLAAKRRGVDVRVVVDHDNNTSEDQSGKSRHALRTLVNAGVPTRTIDTYAIHHDKVIIVDGKHVEVGSFNYSNAAAHRNSENVLVVWNNPSLATTYLKHWQSRYDQGRQFHGDY